MSAAIPSPASGMADMMRLWFETAMQTAEACRAFAGPAVSPDALREGRSSLHKVWGDWWEAYLRSTEFLDLEKQNMKNLATHKRLREQLGRWNRELQLATAEDVDQLMVSVRRIGEQMRDHAEDLEERMAALSSQLESVAGRLEGVEKALAALGDPPADETSTGDAGENGPASSDPARQEPPRNNGTRRRVRRGPSR